MDELHQLIYMDILELYMLDLENDNKILNMAIAMQKIQNQPQPPYNPTPPWVVTCQNTSHTAT